MSRVINSHALNFHKANALFYRALNLEKFKQYPNAVSDFEYAIKLGISPEQGTVILTIAEKFYNDGKIVCQIKTLM